MPDSNPIPFDNTYAKLPDAFHSRMPPRPVAAPSLIAANRELARQLNIDADWLSSSTALAVFAGNAVPPGAEPLAMAYAGHQFGGWVPRLGDGRALLLGEVVDCHGVRRDLHLKGSGPTPFSRGGDGRSSIGPVVREYLASEAMAALGIPTTRALAAVATGEPVLRDGAEVPGGILCRVATSHVRVGTFEYFAHSGRPEAVRTLADYVINRHYPHLAGSAMPYTELLDQVVSRTADLVASWMLVGFIHGVMNTDNTSIVGETIDFGPFGYIDTFNPATVYSSIDRHGRYAYNQQPAVAHWNLARLAECLLPLFDENQSTAVDQANDILSRFEQRFETRFHTGLMAKLGIVVQPAEAISKEDLDLAFALLECMTRNQADMTLTFRRLGDLSQTPGADNGPVRELFAQPQEFDAWAEPWRRRLAAVGRNDTERRAAMRAVNPAFILRNHLAQQAVDAAIERLDFTPMRELQEVLAYPYRELPDHGHLYLPPQPEERVLRTFCGT